MKMNIALCIFVLLFTSTFAGRSCSMSESVLSVDTITQTSCDGKRFCEYDCSSIPTLNCQTPKKLKAKWAKNFDERMDDVKEQYEKGVKDTRLKYSNKIKELAEKSQKSQQALKAAFAKRDKKAIKNARYDINYYALSKRFAQRSLDFRLKNLENNYNFEKNKIQENFEFEHGLNLDTKLELKDKLLKRIDFKYQSTMKKIEFQKMQREEYAKENNEYRIAKAQFAKENGDSTGDKLFIKARFSYEKELKDVQEWVKKSQEVAKKDYENDAQNVVNRVNTVRGIKINNIISDFQKKKTKLEDKDAQRMIKNLYKSKISKSPASEKALLLKEMNWILSSKSKTKEVALGMLKTRRENLLSQIRTSFKDEKAKEIVTREFLGKSIQAIPPGYVAPKLESNVLVLPFPVEVHVTDNIGGAYDTTCITQTSEKSQLVKLLSNLKNNIKKGRFPFNDQAAIALANNPEFRHFWVTTREFCKTVVEGMVPKERALNSFFNYKWSKNSPVPALIQEVNRNEYVPKKYPVALFFDQLASWATANQDRCKCEDIKTLVMKGEAPNGRDFGNRYRTMYGSLIPSFEETLHQRCIAKYPGICIPIKK